MSATDTTILQDAIAQAQDDPDETPDIERVESEIDDIEIQVANREWRVQGHVMVQRGRGGPVEEVEFDRTYVQKPLSLISMMQFTGMIGEKLTEAMSGPDGLTVDGVVGDPEMLAMTRGIFTREDFSSVDALVKGLAKLAYYVPDVLEEAQCIWLQIPLMDRPAVKQIWARSPEDGGLHLSEGQEMIEVFLAQNYKEIEDFFVERLPRLLKLVAKLRARSSRRSKH